MDNLPAELQGKDIEVTGVVAEMPRQHERGLSFAFDVECTHTPGAHVPRRVLLFTYNSEEEEALALHAGERWQLTVRLKQAPVSVFATANNIKFLPPEFLRKGRFDEVFFLDGQSWNWEGVRFEVLHPSDENHTHKNNSNNNLSCVLRTDEDGAIIVTAEA